MSILFDEISRAFEEITRVTVSITGNDPASIPTFLWKNQTYKAISAIQGEAEIFGAGGLAPDFHLTLTVQLSVFDVDTPHPKQFLVYNNRQYKIQTVDTTPDQSGIIIKCNDPSRGSGILEREM